jgi:hypothetical protein
MGLAADLGDGRVVDAAHAPVHAQGRRHDDSVACWRCSPPLRPCACLQLPTAQLLRCHGARVSSSRRRPPGLPPC